MSQRIKCSRCGRVHSGVCGIPPSSTMRGGSQRHELSGQPGYTVKPHNKQEDRRAYMKNEGRRTLLKDLLAKNQEWQATVREQLKAVPENMPEYNDLMEKLDQLIDNEQTLRRQLAVL